MPNMNSANLSDILVSMGMYPCDLAGETGICVSVIKQILKGTPPSTKSRCLIEAAFQRPIWSSQEEYDERCKIRTLMGIEPYSMTMDDLKGMALDCGVRYYELPSLRRESVIAAIVAAKEKQAAIKNQKRPLSADQIERYEAVIDEFLDSGQWTCLQCHRPFTPSTTHGASPQRCPCCRSTRIVPDIDHLKKRLVDSIVDPKGEKNAQNSAAESDCGR